MLPHMPPQQHKNNTCDDMFNARVSDFSFTTIFLFIEQPTCQQVNLIIKKQNENIKIPLKAA